MTRILALDTSTDACSAAISDGEQRVSTRFELAAKSHTQRALPMVDEVLAEAGWSLRDLDAIAFGCGPGSFTGLRIGMGVVQGLALGAGKPVIPVSTLRTMAFEQLERAGANDAVVLSALDARMGEVYWGLYQATTDNPAKPLLDERVAPPDSVRANLPARCPSVTGVGSGWRYDAMARIGASYELEAYPRAEYLVRLAHYEWEKGLAQSVESVQPTYLRNTVSWKKRERIRSRQTQ